MVTYLAKKGSAVQECLLFCMLVLTGSFSMLANRDEPEHVHVERDQNSAKFWLDPVRLEQSGGFGRAELRQVQRIVEENRLMFLEAWHDYFQS